MVSDGSGEVEEVGFGEDVLVTHSGVAVDIIPAGQRVAGVDGGAGRPGTPCGALEDVRPGINRDNREKRIPPHQCGELSPLLRQDTRANQSSHLLVH